MGMPLSERFIGNAFSAGYYRFRRKGYERKGYEMVTVGALREIIKDTEAKDPYGTLGCRCPA
jgi:hypothetical protein